jgi:Carboxypeptidase regulatory-like domain
MTYNWHKTLTSGLILFLLGSGSKLLSAQAIGSIRGTVTDTSQAVINGAAIVAIDSATGVSRSEVTNQEGIFVFPDLPIGAYRLQISRSGFQTQKRDGIVLLTGQTLDLQLSLSVGSETQSVEVTSAAPLIQTASSSIQTSVDQKQMQDLPLNGRNPLQLTTLTPGTALTNPAPSLGNRIMWASR